MAISGAGVTRYLRSEQRAAKTGAEKEAVEKNITSVEALPLPAMLRRTDPAAAGHAALHRFRRGLLGSRRRPFRAAPTPPPQAMSRSTDPARC